jgi:hypothetical protein
MNYQTEHHHAQDESVLHQEINISRPADLPDRVHGLPSSVVIKFTMTS